jgi:hypothetical protein
VSRYGASRMFDLRIGGRKRLRGYSSMTRLRDNKVRISVNENFDSNV